MKWLRKLFKRLFGVGDKFHNACKHHYEATAKFMPAEGD